MKIGSLFSGIGGLDLAVEAHFEAAPAWFVERDPYCKQVLAKRWPGVPILDDVREVGAGDVEPPDVLCGGFPCQDLSAAGTRSGLVDGDRSALFFEMARIVAELRPRYVVLENVPALLKWRGVVERSLDGYGLTWVKVSAAHVGAPHLRRRVFVLAERGAAHRGVVEAGKVPRVDRWPTHNASGFQDYQTPAQHMERSARLVEQGTRPIGVQLPIAVQPAALWPSVSGMGGGQTSRGGDRKGERLIGGAVQPAAHWQTPRAKQTMGPTEYDRNSPSLHCEVQPAARWPTATRNDYKNAGYQSANGKDFRTLPGATGSAPQRGGVQPAARWTSPIARDWKDAGHSPNLSIDTLPRQATAPSGADSNRSRSGGQATTGSSARLSPSWVELLMGFPMGWTDLDCDNPIALPFPAPMVKGQWGDSPQHDFEPLRTVTGKQAHRTARLRALGNAVVSAQALQALALAVQGPRQAMLLGATR